MAYQYSAVDFVRAQGPNKGENDARSILSFLLEQNGELEAVNGQVLKGMSPSSWRESTPTNTMNIRFS